MTFRIATRVTVVLAATAALAQSAQPGTTPGAPILNRQSLAGRRGPVGNKTADPQGLAAMRERVKDMESTLSQMRVVLKQMNAKAAKSKATDSLTKANLGMLELRVQLAHHQFPTARDIGSTRRLRGSCRSLQAGGCQDKKPRLKRLGLLRPRDSPRLSKMAVGRRHLRRPHSRPDRVQKEVPRCRLRRRSLPPSPQATTLLRHICPSCINYGVRSYYARLRSPRVRTELDRGGKSTKQILTHALVGSL
jgi:hypothetical protein